MTEPNEAVGARFQALVRDGGRAAILAPGVLDEINAMVAVVADPGRAAGLAENAAGLVAAAELCGRRGA